MQFVKDFGKLLGVYVGLTLFFGGVGSLLGGTSKPNTLEYHLYEQEIAEDFAEQELLEIE